MGGKPQKWRMESWYPLWGWVAAVAVFYLLAPSGLYHPQTQAQYPAFQLFYPAAMLLPGVPSLMWIFRNWSSGHWKFWLSLTCLSIGLPSIALVAGHLWAGSLVEAQFPEDLGFLGMFLVISLFKLNALLCLLVMTALPLTARLLHERSHRQVDRAQDSTDDDVVGAKGRQI